MRFLLGKDADKKKSIEEVIETAANNLMQKINRKNSSEIPKTHSSEIVNETLNKNKKISKAVVEALARLRLLRDGSKKEHESMPSNLSHKI
ncbi:MAG: hypothetical protein QXX08_02170 [Candidatus Bathyarchaeia archaeon]